MPQIGKNRRFRKYEIIGDDQYRGLSRIGHLPSLAELTSVGKFKLKQCHKLEKIEVLERLTSLKMEVYISSKRPCAVLEHSENLKSLVVVANDRPAIEPFISDMQKWPREVIICTRAVIDVGLPKNFLTTFPLKNVVEFGLYGGLKLSRPESSANANAILICFSIQYVSPKLLFQIYTDRGNHFHTELANGRWLWMGVFPQDSDWLQSDRYEIWASSEDKDVKVKEAWLVMGEVGSILEAFRQLTQS
ncbi:hypothetical protein SUGI_0095300 [Cryptomeria japonica]|nr:hypothetical protein SUGI_0095300 [Cryptomeria japonica]